MAERSYLWPTTGTGDGPSGGYPYTQIAEMMEALYPTGVLWGLSTNASGFNVIISPGKAIVQGVLYTNDAPLTLTVANPGSGNTRRDLVVLRGNASARTVRLVIKSGFINSGAYPTLQQDASFPASGVFEIQIAQLLVTSSGATIAGGPIMTTPRGIVGRAQIAEGAVTASKIADETIDASKLADNSVTEDKVAFSFATADRRWAGSSWLTLSGTRRIATAQLTVPFGAGETGKVATISLNGAFNPGTLLYVYAQVYADDLVWVSNHGWWDTTNNIYSFTVRRNATNATGYLLSAMFIGPY